jgi:hypothetical protein
MKSLLTAVLALSAVAFGTAAANAHDHHGHFSFGIVIGEPGYGPGWGGYPDDYGWDRPVHVVRGCSANQASAIARDYGFRHRSVYVSSRVLTVTGVRHGRPAEITFARAPGCPVVSY